MSYNPENSNGQATSANSSPVVIASDQSAVPVSASSLPLPTGAALDATLTGGSAKTQGNVAAGATDSGNPVKAGGVYNSASPTLTTGQRGDLQLDSSGNLKVVSGGTQTVSGTVTVQQSTAANLKVDLSGTGANTTALKVDGSASTQPVSGTVTANAGTGTFGVNMSQINGSAVSTGNGTASGAQRVTLASDSTGQVALASGSTVGLSAGANTVGNVGINAGTNAIGTVSLSPTTSGGWSVSSQVVLTTTATVSGALGKFGGYMFINPNTSTAYIQVFDTTGAVTLGTTAPTFVVPIPAGAAANVEFTNGIAMANGIKVAATTLATGSGTVATALTGFVLYK